MAQKKYALVINNMIHSTFYSDKPKRAFPDIAHLLVEVSDEVCCNDYWIDGTHVKRPAPIETIDDNGLRNVIVPPLEIQINKLSTASIIVGILLGVGAGAVSYFF